jgi:death-on-curing protein
VIGEPIWLSQSYVEAFHEDQLLKNGGLAGVRDPGALNASLARPVNLFHYEPVDLCALAACYAHGIVKSHPFFDGNKRVAFVAAATFLDLNGVEITLSEPQATVAMLDLTRSALSQEQFAALLRSHSRPTQSTS